MNEALRRKNQTKAIKRNYGTEGQNGERMLV